MKQKCTKRAFEMLEDGMVVGLGGGSTVALLIQEIKNGGSKLCRQVFDADGGGGDRTQIGRKGWAAGQ